jgi:type I restriction enzyme S subunit
MTTALSKLEKLKPNKNWAKLPLFNRKNWSRVRFDDVVENLNETCDPAEAGLERVIAMEHLEPGSLHIRSWGNVADGTTFTRRCRAGQVLFGKRRAYQRKVAVAEFDAVVSGDIYVLAPKGDRLLPELLPFLCLSERFFQHAVGTSAGSLSPRTNWSSLASFEFDLPPLDQQRRIADILWAVDETIEKQLELASASASAADWTRNEHFSKGNRFKLRPMRETGKWVSGNTPSRGRGDFWNGSFPWVSPKDMKQPLISDSEEHLSDAGRKESTVVVRCVARLFHQATCPEGDLPQVSNAGVGN